MNILTPVFDETVELVKAVWPEVGGSHHPIYRMTEAQRFAWRKAIDAKNLAAPWVVIGYGAQTRTSGWGATNVMYTIPMTVYYVGQQGPHTGDDISGWMTEKLAQFTDVLESAEQGGFPFQVLDGATPDVSENNGVNMGLIANNLALFAGSVRFTVLAGYVSEIVTENAAGN